MHPELAVFAILAILWLLSGDSEIKEFTRENRPARIDRVLRGIDTLAKLGLHPQLSQLADEAQKFYDHPSDPLEYRPHSNQYHKLVNSLDQEMLGPCRRVYGAYHNIDHRIVSYKFCEASPDFSARDMQQRNYAYLHFMRAYRICEQLFRNHEMLEQDGIAPEKQELAWMSKSTLTSLIKHQGSSATRQAQHVEPVPDEGPSRSS